MALTWESYILIFIVVVLHLLVLKLVRKPRTKSVSGKHVVVTGGSSGIGLWTAIYCAQLGADVTIVARNKNLLKKAEEVIKNHCKDKAGQKIQSRSLDLSQSYESVRDEFEKLEAEVGEIFMLVNCAGLAICGEVDSFPVEDAKKLMDINYFGTFYPTRYVLPKMKENESGIIVITASQAALLGIYGYGAYAASKFALRGLAETIQMEVAHKGVSVTLCLPCDTDTPGFEREEKTKPVETKIISESGGLVKPEVVAKRLVEDALKGEFFSIYGLESWILSSLCVGMAPWKGVFLNIFHFIFLGPLRMVGLLIRWNFGRIIRSCNRYKPNHQKVE